MKIALTENKCRYCSRNAPAVDYKDINGLQKYASAQGKMFDRKRTGLCAKHQRQVGTAIKRARFLSLMRYVGK